MTKRIAFTLALLAALAVAGPAATDVWDQGADNDNGTGTDTEITHGFSQVHDLGAQPGPVPDEDWYFISQEAFSSYEILCDGFTGDINPTATTLQRVDIGANVLQDSSNYGYIGYARSLRFANDTAAPPPNTEFVRVRNAACGTACTTNDQYRIRAWETTVAVPRYNNFGGQVTVLIIQNTGPATVSGNARLWTAAGGASPVTTIAFTLNARAAAVINLATVNGGVANGTSGTLTITNDGRYGQLAVKAVALEPATGFSFDSPGLYKPVS